MRRWLTKKNFSLGLGVAMLAGLSIWLNQDSVRNAESPPASGPMAAPQRDGLENIPAVSKDYPAPRDEAEALIRSASEDYFYHQFDSAAESYRKAIAIYEQRNERDKAAKIYESLGDLFNFAHKPEEAEKNFKLAIEYHHRIANPLGEARAMKSLADLHVQLEKMPSAGEWYRQALAIAQEQPQPSLTLAQIQEALGHYSWQAEDKPQAIAFFKQARETFTAIKNMLGVGQMNNVLARLEGNSGDLHDHARRAGEPPFKPKR